ARLFETRRRRVSRDVRKRSRDHDALALERPGRFAGARLPFGKVQAVAAKRLDEVAVLRMPEPGPDRGGGARADVAAVLQLLLARRGQAVEGSEAPRERAGRLLTHVADPEGEEEAREFRLLARRDLGEQVRRRLLAPALELDEVFGPEVV